MNFIRLSLLFLLALFSVVATPAAGKSTGDLTTLTVGPYVSDQNSALTGAFQGTPLSVLQTYRNTSSVLQDSLAFTVQCFGPNYSAGLVQFFGTLKAVGANGGQDSYLLGDIQLPGPGSYLVQTDVFVYDRDRKDWVAGPSHVYWLFPTAPTPLPVELVSFTAKVQADSTTVQWQTASERNCFGFWLERSTDGLAYAPLQFVAGHGTSARANYYQLRDGLPQLRTHYYRLRQVDVGGKQQYSPVVSVAPVKPTATSVYPNPARDQAHVTFTGPARLYDQAGRLISQQQLDASGRLELGGVPASTYLLVLGEGASAQRLRLAIY
jgi:hypothetical protein